LHGFTTNESSTLNWSASTGATGYRIYRSQTNGGQYLLDSDLSTTTFKDFTVLSGQTYYYVVTAYATAGESAFSNQATAVIPGCALPAYCTALTSVNTPGAVQYAVPAPNMGNLSGRNTVITDRNFGSRIVRVTESNYPS